MRQQCPRCGEEPHPKLTCEEARANRLYEQSEEGQVAVHRIASISRNTLLVLHVHNVQSVL